MSKTFTYSRRSVRRIGRYQGKDYTAKFFDLLFKSPKAPYPPVSQKEPAQFEVEILTLAEREISDVAEEWKEKDKKLKTTYCQARAERAIALKKFNEEEADVAPEEANVEEVSEELMRHQSAPIKHRTALLFHILVFIGEVFFNAIVFSIFGFEIWESYGVAAVMGIAITILAYFFGKFLKKENKNNIEKIWTIVIPVLAVIVIIAMSALRAEYFKEVNESADSAMGIHISMALTVFGFIAINLVIFGAGALISFMSFTKNETLLETLRKQYRNAISRLKKERREAADAARRFETADKNYIAAREIRRKEFDRLSVHAKTIKAQGEYLVEVYRTANMEVRRDSIKPECFKQQPIPILLPSEFNPDLLDWDCNDNPDLHLRNHQNN